MQLYVLVCAPPFNHRCICTCVYACICKLVLSSVFQCTHLTGQPSASKVDVRSDSGMEEVREEEVEVMLEMEGEGPARPMW